MKIKKTSNKLIIKVICASTKPVVSCTCNPTTNNCSGSGYTSMSC